MKKIFSFAVLFAAMSLVACGGEQPKAEEAAEVAVEEVVAAPAEAPAEVPAEAPEMKSEPSVKAVEKAQNLTVSGPANVKVEAAATPNTNKLTVSEIKQPETGVKVQVSEGATLKVTDNSGNKALQVGPNKVSVKTEAAE